MSYKVTNFEEIQMDILQVVNERIRLGHLKNMHGFLLINGFISMQVQNQTQSSFGRRLDATPMQCAGFLNQQTGEMRLFPIKALLPHIEL